MRFDTTPQTIFFDQQYFSIDEFAFMILMIDNYDSFTYNIVQYLAELDAKVKVVKNDEITVSEIEDLLPEKIVISPGPCTPNEAGISLDVIESFAGRIPILGICLGHQSIAQAFGGSVVRAAKVMHGKTSQIHHSGDGVFAGVDNPFTATRYHSLVVQANSLPDCFNISAWTQNSEGGMEEIMGLKHKTLDVEGVQFHPESILSEHGHQLLENFLRLSPTKNKYNMTNEKREK